MATITTHPPHSHRHLPSVDIDPGPPPLRSPTLSASSARNCRSRSASPTPSTPPPRSWSPSVGLSTLTVRRDRPRSPALHTPASVGSHTRTPSPTLPSPRVRVHARPSTTASASTSPGPSHGGSPAASSDGGASGGHKRRRSGDVDHAVADARSDVGMEIDLGPSVAEVPFLVARAGHDPAHIRDAADMGAIDSIDIDPTSPTVVATTTCAQCAARADAAATDMLKLATRLAAAERGAAASRAQSDKLHMLLATNQERLAQERAHYAAMAALWGERIRSLEVENRMLRREAGARDGGGGGGGGCGE